jgi:hypothetical protein
MIIVPPAHRRTMFYPGVLESAAQMNNGGKLDCWQKIVAVIGFKEIHLFHEV